MKNLSSAADDDKVPFEFTLCVVSDVNEVKIFLQEGKFYLSYTVIIHMSRNKNP